MAVDVQIQCINKSDRYDAHDRIRYVGGVNADGSRWKLSQQQAIAAVEAGKWAFFVLQQYRRVRVVVAVSRFGNK